MDRVRRPGLVLALLGAISGAIYLAYVALYPLPVHGQVTPREEPAVRLLLQPPVRAELVDAAVLWLVLVYRQDVHVALFVRAAQSHGQTRRAAHSPFGVEYGLAFHVEVVPPQPLVRVVHVEVVPPSIENVRTLPTPPSMTPPPVAALCR